MTRRPNLSFQSLTGRLQTRRQRISLLPAEGFNPSQVGYKPIPKSSLRILVLCFNPSQVGYKLNTRRRGRRRRRGFQSLTGRLQTGGISPPETAPTRFNPSQVGYKPSSACARSPARRCFNPSQVGYKPAPAGGGAAFPLCFNPSQVGYKHPRKHPYPNPRIGVSIPHR